MLMHTLLSAVLLIAGMIDLARADPSPPGSPVPTSLAAPPSETPSVTLTTISKWLAETFGLPPALREPRVRLVPAGQIVALRYGSLLAAQPARARRAAERDVMAVYDDASQTIYLPESWTGGSLAEQSVLVHEMTHHLQNSAGLIYACPQEREKLAFAAQGRWLAQFDRSLESEFALDPFTLLVRINCPM